MELATLSHSYVWPILHQGPASVEKHSPMSEPVLSSKCLGNACTVASITPETNRHTWPLMWVGDGLKDMKELQAFEKARLSREGWGEENYVSVQEAGGSFLTYVSWVCMCVCACVCACGCVYVNEHLGHSVLPHLWESKEHWTRLCQKGLSQLFRKRCT